MYDRSADMPLERCDTSVANSAACASYTAAAVEGGGAVAAATGRSDLAARFVKAAAGLRGLVLSVDLPGTIAVGDAVVVIPPVTVKGATR
jgi:hypothetical protein